MYLLNERQSSIIIDLIEINNPVTAKDLSLKYGVSIRTIRYDIELIESWLKKEKIEFTRRPRVGMWIGANEEEKKRLKSKLINLDPFVKFLSKDERKKIIINKLLESKEPITSDDICEEIGVSKTTLLEDIQEIRKDLKDKGVIIQGTPGIGYILKGNEENIRELIGKTLLADLDRFQLLDMLNTDAPMEKSILNNLHKELNLTTNIDMEDIKHAIKMSKKIYDFWIPDSSYISLIIHIAIAIDRLKSNQEIILSTKRIELLKTYKEYILAKEIASELENIYRISIPEAEIANITFHLISANLKLNYLHSENIYDAKSTLLMAIDKIMEYLKENLILPEESWNKLKVDLLSHLKLTLKKIELNIPNTNPLLVQIKENYSSYFKIAREIDPIFFESTGIRLTEDEIGYLTLHIAAHSEMHREKVSKNVLLVCTTGKGLARVLGIKLKKSFPELNILDTVSIFELEDGEVNLENIDFIISTFHISNMEIPVLKINPILTEKDIGDIRNFIYRDDYKPLPYKVTEKSYMLDSLMNVAGKYIDLDNQFNLREEFGQVLEFIITNTSKSDISEGIGINKTVEEIALIMVDIGQLLEELKTSLDEQDYVLQIWGLAIHVIMAIPRWRSTQIHSEFNIEEMTIEQQQIYKVVSKSMDHVARRHNLFISESEKVSMAKYFFRRDEIGK